MTEQEKYKSRMTTLRRQHLRSGLLELYNRKQSMTAQMATRSSARQTERARLMTQPLREDERLTNTSIPSSMHLTSKDTTTHLPDRSTLTRKQAHTTAQNAAKASTRLDALHTLYMHARSFITTERQLSAEIDRIFDHPEEDWETLAHGGDNIWNRDPPATIAALLSEGMASGGARESGLGIHRGATQRFKTDQERMKRLAEVLSGGKM
jgi:hypothetical protein